VQDGPYIFLANHQNNFDLFTHTTAVPKGTVSLGKKSLAWMPLFGQIYWLSGNILIQIFPSLFINLVIATRAASI